jgi:hypothetical protein
MDVGQAKTRFFKRNSEKADQLTIHPHKEARVLAVGRVVGDLFVQKPSDLGYSRRGLRAAAARRALARGPATTARPAPSATARARMFRQAIGVVDAAREKRESLPARMAKLLELRAEDLNAHRVIWHDLEAERARSSGGIPGVVSVYGTRTWRARAASSTSATARSGTRSKPVMLGSGCNFQRHCAWAIFLGIGFKFNDFIQAIHRLQRFLQTHRVRIDLIYTEAEREIRRDLERKWAQHNEHGGKDDRDHPRVRPVARRHGAGAHARDGRRARRGARASASARQQRLRRRDARMASDSVGLILTSIPFSTQYEYSPNYADFGHTDNNAHFFEQMDFLTPELLRVLQPGRLAAIHVKDRIVPGGMTGLGFQTVYPFHCAKRAIEHFRGTASPTWA